MAAGLLFLGSHLIFGGRRCFERLAEQAPLRSHLAATDWWLFHAGVGAATPEVATLLGRVPPRQDVLLVQRKIDPSLLPAWPFVSYIAWPRRLWIFQCDGATAQAYLWPEPQGNVWPRPEDVPWILYFDRQPPKALRGRLGTAGRLTLVAADPKVPWNSYCSR